MAATIIIVISIKAKHFSEMLISLDDRLTFDSIVNDLSDSIFKLKRCRVKIKGSSVVDAELFKVSMWTGKELLGISREQGLELTE